MMGLPLAFATPLLLSALVLLPVIWWLLRLTPPRPRREEFPPTRLLLEIAPKEEQPSKSPWWLTALRLTMAALVIIALAGPVFRPVAEAVSGEGPLLVVMENGWASSPRWTPMLETARRVIAEAGDASRPVTLVATAEGTSQPLSPDDASVALARLEALQPRPWASNRAAIVPALRTIAVETAFGSVAWLADGLGGDDIDAFGAFLGELGVDDIAIYDDARSDLAALTPPASGAESLDIPVIRRAGGTGAAGVVQARDLKGRIIGEASYSFEQGATETVASLELPSELRNEIVRVEIAGMETAGAVQLLDERWRRRRIGLLSGGSADAAQPLLSPLYYIARALSPYADIREPRDANAALAVPDVIEAGVSIIAMADIGTLTPEIEKVVSDWVSEGGTLVRFAGPRLAAATDALTPVRLRRGGRILGGSLSWQTPQKLGFFSADSPFAGMTIPDDIEIKRQVLAEPDGDLSERTWAGLADGTPLVTAAPLGRGRVILFHITADTGWSNLPISGTFVEMLRRIVAVSNAVGTSTPDQTGASALLPPYRLLDGFGRFTAPEPAAQPIESNAANVIISADHPPGLYGVEDGFLSLNLLDSAATLPRFDPGLVDGASVRAYPTEAPRDLAPFLLSAAAILLILDALAVLWLGGAFTRRLSYAASIAAAVMLGAVAVSGPLEAQPASAADSFAMELVNQTRLAYVVTGNSEIDEASHAGLRGLSRVLAERTALEPGEPRGVDVARDELAFFPLLYWPVDPDAPPPSSATMARVDAFMKQGGSILFDTRDQLARSTTFSTFSGTPAQERLRDILAGLDIPPLEPVPTDHVLTKAFYLLTEFPGRYVGGALWVEAMQPEEEGQEDRPARGGDGVTSILITANDFAGAWAEDEAGMELFPTVPADPLQREFAFRSGVNIVMYTLTGNYKADQVHVPALLERLGQ